MEIKLVGARGVSEKTYVSIRVGESRKQQLYKEGDCFKFDTLSKVPRHFVVDLFEKVGSKQVAVADLKEDGCDGTIVGCRGLDMSSSVIGLDLSLDLDVKLATPKDSVGGLKSPSRKSRHNDALQAKQYLDSYSVQQFLQAMVHKMILTRPKDPYEYMIGYISSRGVTPLDAEKPNTSTETDAPPLPDGAPPPLFVDGSAQQMVRNSGVSPQSMLGKELPTQPMPDTDVPPQQVRPCSDDDAEGPSNLPIWSSQPGLGNEALPGFAPSGPIVLPDLTRHHSILAKLVRKNPSLCEGLQGPVTKKKSTLAHCIKPGMDHEGHKLVRTGGLVAHDEECYDVFREVFDPVITAWHPGFDADGTHPYVTSIPDCADVVDPGGQYVLSVQLQGSRNLSGLRMPSGMLAKERFEAERMLVHGLLSLEEDLVGEYFPLRGSKSFVPKPSGMSLANESALRAKRLLFDPPSSKEDLSAGFGRHWPQGRGVFVNDCADLAVFVNEFDHLKIIARQEGSHLGKTLSRFHRVEAYLQKAMQAFRRDFSYSDRLGFLTSKPSSLGDVLTVTVCFPQTTRNRNFRSLCRELSVNCKCVSHTDGIWNLTSSCRLGISVAEQMGLLTSACRRLTEMETELEVFDANSAKIVDDKSMETDASLFTCALTAPCSRGLPSLVEEMMPTPSHLDSVPIAPVISKDMRGLGADDFPGFPADICPVEMPELVESHSMAACVLRNDPSIYDDYREVTTAGCVPFAKCIKPCFDICGHPMFRTIGIVAGDAHCYENFRRIFDPVLALQHTNFDLANPAARHPTNLSYEEIVDSIPPDMAIAVRACVVRNICGFRMPTACSLQERRDVESCVIKAMQDIPITSPAMKYYSLRGSGSRPEQLGGMTSEEAAQFENEELHSGQPDSSAALSSGIGRHWPDARGVFVDDKRSVIAHINFEDHLRLAVRQPGGDLRMAFERLCTLHEAIHSSLKEQGADFAQDDRLGFLGSCPSNVGTCLAAGVTLRLPQLSSTPGLRLLCKRLGLLVCSLDGTSAFHSGSADGCCEVLNADRLGSSEVDQVSTVIRGCKMLAQIETRLAQGEQINLDEYATSASGSSIVAAGCCSSQFCVHSDIPGLNDADYGGFPVDICPDVMPDLTSHCSVVTDILHKEPSIYNGLRDGRTSIGTSFARCIKTGFDNPGHPITKTIGVVAGDAECYDIFKAMFEPVICKVHHGYSAATIHPTDLNYEKVPATPLDVTGRYVISVRIDGRRNLASLPYPSSASSSARAEVEQLLSTALNKALVESSIAMEGQYLPLRGSSSFSAIPGGMSRMQEDDLSKHGILFHVPDAKQLLCTGVGRFWPSFRGVWTSTARCFAARVNDEDHLQLIVLSSDGGLYDAFARFCVADASIRSALQAEGHDFARNTHLGFLSSDPGNLGTGLRAEVVLRLPLLSLRETDLRAMCKKLNVQARRHGKLNESEWAVARTAQLGTSEVNQVVTLVLAVQCLVSAESRMEVDEEVDVQALVDEVEDADVLRSSGCVSREVTSAACAATGVSTTAGSDRAAQQQKMDVRRKAKDSLITACKNAKLKVCLEQTKSGW